MESLPFEIVKGHRSDSNLLWISVDQNLYYKKCNRNGNEEYECYQTILRKNRKMEYEAMYCTAGAVIKNGVCSHTTVRHTFHSNHKEIYVNLKARNSILDKCKAIKEITEDFCITVPARDIFTREMAKYVLPSIFMSIFHVWFCLDSFVGSITNPFLYMVISIPNPQLFCIPYQYINQSIDGWMDGWMNKISYTVMTNCFGVFCVYKNVRRRKKCGK